MTPLTIGALALVIGLVVGAATVMGAPIFALPIVAVVLGVMALNELQRRRNAGSATGGMRSRRRDAGLERVEMTEDDRATLTEAAPRDHGGG